MARKRNALADVERWSRQLRSGNKATRVEATAKLCDALEPLVRAMVHQYRQSQKLLGAETEELEQTARVGLLEACRTFNRARGSFVAHAQWSIRSALAIYIGDLANPVRLPHKFTFCIPKLRRLLVQLSHSLMRRPTIAELSHALGKPEWAILAMLAHDQGGVSLSYPSNDRAPEAWSEQLPSGVPTPEEALIEQEEAHALMTILRRRKEKSV